MPKGYSEAINPRTDNTVAKRKKTKGQTIIYETLQKTKYRAARIPLRKKVVGSGAPVG